KRVPRKQDLNDCLCGDVVEPSVERVVKCKQPGCETQWYHLDCVNLGATEIGTHAISYYILL
ncbi:hypothetical protein BYT27DRAFT_7078697, partial [Phlegmacium glaucopus]